MQGFYYVDVDGTVYESRLRGILKKTDRKENCVVGDIVELCEDFSIIKIFPRKNLLLRPVVANIDNFIIQFACKNPVIDYERLNILLLHSMFNKINPIIVINKIDLVTEEELLDIKKKLIYLEDIDVPIYYISQEKNIGLDALEDYLKDKINAFGGPSGVGKSSIINMFQNERFLKTGETSVRLKRGKHTTRDSNLMLMKNGGFIIDTPGFSSVEIPLIKDFDSLIQLFPEINKAKKNCKFTDCIHINEPQCGVKDLLITGEFSEYRYEFYKKVYNLLKNERWNKYD